MPGLKLPGNSAILAESYLSETKRNLALRTYTALGYYRKAPFGIITHVLAEPYYTGLQ